MGEKSKNIEDIAKDLNIGLDSMVFGMTILMKEMSSTKSQSTYYRTEFRNCRMAKSIKIIRYVFKFKITDEDKNKTKQYKSREEFELNLKKFDDQNNI